MVQWDLEKVALNERRLTQYRLTSLRVKAYTERGEVRATITHTHRVTPITPTAAFATLMIFLFW